jgi:hypothetical protein
VAQERGGGDGVATRGDDEVRRSDDEAGRGRRRSDAPRRWLRRVVVSRFASSSVGGGEGSRGSCTGASWCTGLCGFGLGLSVFASAGFAVASGAAASALGAAAFGASALGASSAALAWGDGRAGSPTAAGAGSSVGLVASLGFGASSAGLAASFVPGFVAAAWLLSFDFDPFARYQKPSATAATSSTMTAKEPPPRPPPEMLRRTSS